MNRGTTSDDDFGFLEFGDLQLDYPAFDGETRPHQTPGEERDDGHNDGSMDTDVDMLGMPAADLDQALDAQMQIPMADLQQHMDIESHLFEQSAVQTQHQRIMSQDQHLQYPQLKQQQQHHGRGQYMPHGNMVPPTPTSMEISGHSLPYTMSVPEAAIYRSFDRKQDNSVFTPLGTPAVTPRDTSFQIAGYAVPGEYLSPITSPAIQAQNYGTHHHRSAYHAMHGSDTSTTTTTSPVDATQPDITISLTSDPAASSARKSKRKSQSSATKDPIRSVRESPAMKPQRRKRTSSTIITPETANEVMLSMQNTVPPAKSGRLNTVSVDSSDAGSTSPEPLSEILMPPPATPGPGSVRKSPLMPAPNSGNQGVPVTPASLMRISPQASANGQNRSASTPVMPSIGQPAQDVSSMHEPGLEGSTAVIGDGETTPKLSPKKQSASVPVSSSQSPTAATPGSANAGQAKRDSANQAGRTGKKRQQSSHTSPAIRPRISPSIKPLLPEGVPISTPMTPAETALLLATKSNYQNLLEGNRLHGVTFPETLSEGLSQKRVSHKLAEQGRRDRMNIALQEMASLIPSEVTSALSKGKSGKRDGDGDSEMTNKGSDKAAAAVANSNSKASTVEIAVEYIKMMQLEMKRKDDEIHALKAKAPAS